MPSQTNDHIRICRAVDQHLPGFKIAAIDGDEILWVDETEPTESQLNDALAAYDAGEIDRVKAEARTAIIARADQFTAPILSRYPEAERAGWGKREAEARAIITAQDKVAAIDATSVIKTLAEAAGENTVGTVARAEAIAAKADEFAAISAAVEIMRATALVAIDAVADPADMPATLDALNEQATALAVEYGLA